MRRFAICWWGSFPTSGATIGDFLAADSVRVHLSDLGYHAELVPYSKKPRELIEAIIVSDKISDLVFVCGPLITHNKYVSEIMSLSRTLPVFAIGCTILESTCTRGIKCFARDEEVRGIVSFDLAPSHPMLENIIDYRAEAPKNVGICLRGEQSEYVLRSLHSEVEKLLAIVGEHSVIDTRLNLLDNLTNQVQGVFEDFSRSSFIITTRLHGCLISGALGRPFIAIDQIERGGKVKAHAECAYPENLVEIVDFDCAKLNFIRSQVNQVSHIESTRNRIIANSKEALANSCHFVLNN